MYCDFTGSIPDYVQIYPTASRFSVTTPATSAATVAFLALWCKLKIGLTPFRFLIDHFSAVYFCRWYSTFVCHLHQIQFRKLEYRPGLQV